MKVMREQGWITRWGGFDMNLALFMLFVLFTHAVVFAGGVTYAAWQNRSACCCRGVTK